MTDTQRQIHSTISEIKKLTSIQKHHDSTSQQLEEAYQELNQLEDGLVKELKDIEKLEQMSLKSVFYKVLGSQEEQLEKERQEYLQVSLKHKELKKGIEVLEFEHKILSTKVQGITGLESDLDELKKLRLREILVSDTQQRLQITGLHQNMDDYRAEAEELRQAKNAGDNCLKAIQITLKHLKDAENWGNWDMMNKGSYYARQKHGAMDRAMEAAQRVSHQLRIFDRELIDVNIEQTHLKLNLEGFSRFMDVFFDNLISDWVIQRKIKNAINSVATVYDKIKVYIGVIEREQSKLENAIETLESDLNDILIS